MARIRCIKPEFPQSESMGRVSRDARLTFIQLWTISDDAGRLRGNSRMLASLLFPYDDDASALVDGWLQELERESCIARYKSDGQNYVQILNWLNHQKIDKPSASKIPPFVESSRILATDSIPLPVGMEGIGMEGIGMDISAKKNRRSQIPDDFYPNETGVEKVRSSELVFDVEFENFKNYHRGKGNVMADWQAAWLTWVGNAVKFRKGNSNGRGYESERDKSRRIAVRELTGYDPDAIKGVSTRVD